MSAGVPSWAKALTGKPFRLGADGPDEFDCWGVVRAGFRAAFRVELPALHSVRAASMAQQQRAAHAESDWRPATALDVDRPGTVLTFRRRRGVHVGLVVCRGMMLHSLIGRGTEIARYTVVPWASTRMGAWRLVDFPDAAETPLG